MQLMREKDGWKAIVSKSEIKTKNFQTLNVLSNEPAFFVPAHFQVTEDEVLFTYEIGVNRSLVDVQLTMIEKLKFLVSINRFSPLVEGLLTVNLNPKNIVVDFNDSPMLVHRGIVEILEPTTATTAEDFFVQYKSLVVSLFSKKFSYEDLVNGNLSRAKDSQFVKDVVLCETKDDLLVLLQTHLEKEEHYQRTKLKYVPKGRYKLFLQLTILLGVAAVILGGFLAYDQLVKIPLQNTLLAADEAFIAKDNQEVISTLENVDVDKLPIASKYELAYCYVSAEPFTDVQLNNILNNMSLNSEEAYLDFWIYYGNGNFDQALDIARKLDDVELKIAALGKKIEETQNNKNLSGKEREEELDKLNKELDKYTEELNQAVNPPAEDGEAVDATTPVDAGSTTPSEGADEQ